VHGVQTTVVMITVFTLVLVALFAERRQSEETLKQSKNRLQFALDGAELGIFSANLITGQFECDMRAALLHGHNVPPTTIKQVRRLVHRDDLARIDAAMAEASRTGGVWNAEYRVLHPPPRGGARQIRARQASAPRRGMKARASRYRFCLCHWAFLAMSIANLPTEAKKKRRRCSSSGAAGRKEISGPLPSPMRA